MAESQQNNNDLCSTSPKQSSPPIIMKVDPPNDDTTTIDNESGDSNLNNYNNKNCEEFKICSPTNNNSNNTLTTNKPTDEITSSSSSSSSLSSTTTSTTTTITTSTTTTSTSTITTSTTTTTTTTTTSPNKSYGILKPAQLSFKNATTNNCIKSSPFALNPSRLNPLTNKITDETETTKINQQTNGDSPQFVPLLQQNELKQNTQQTVVTQPTFVFGQNLQDRVLSSTNQDEPKPSTSLNTNGSNEMLFTSALKNDGKVECKKETKSLSESAREYEESRANKRRYEEVEVITGEEEETNIISLTCKLFAFDKGTVSWQERGRGTLRLNDFDESENHTQSRLVFRTSGSLRVVLNTKIWAEMTVEQASEKSIRFTALDSNGEIKVFLATANIEDCKNLYNQLNSRVRKEMLVRKQKKDDK